MNAASDSVSRREEIVVTACLTSANCVRGVYRILICRT